MRVTVTWQQALAWRMERQLLEPVGKLPVAGVVRRLCAVQTQVPSSAELAIRVRRQASRPGEVGRALADGRLIKTWAMRGTLHLLTPEEGGMLLSLIAAARPWERPAWSRYFGMTPQRIERLGDAVREALDTAVLTRDELIAVVTARPGLDDLDEALRSGWGTLFKPFAWQGDLCFGPSRAGRATFTRPERASRRWAGLPDPAEAASAAVVSYLRAYGPATIDAFGRWLAGGWFGKRQIRGWFEALGDRLAQVDVDGDSTYVVRDDLDGLASARPTPSVRLLPGFDQYVLGPGTADPSVMPPARRRAVSRQSGWISPVVVAGGVVGGTWQLDDAELRIGWFREAGLPPRRALEDEATRIASMLGRDTRTTITLV